MPRTRVYGYRRGLYVPQELSRRLGFYRVYEGWNQSVRYDDMVLNWGSSTFPITRGDCYVLNLASAVRVCTNKMRTFYALKEAGVPAPEWTTNELEARVWCEEGNAVYCRTSVSGARGQGIVIAQSPSELVPSRLYTKALDRAREYRVYTFLGNAYHMAQKRRRRECPNADSRIKNMRNGWIFAFNNITEPPSDIKQVALQATRAVGLDFAAVDIAVKGGQCYVLELNSAPGLHGTSLDRFIHQVSRWVNRNTQEDCEEDRDEY